MTKSDALELADISDTISGHGKKIGEFSGVKRANAVLPAQHFCSVGGDRARDSKRRASGRLSPQWHGRNRPHKPHERYGELSHAMKRS